MKQQPKRYLITSALPYANGQKHVGHLAGGYIPADIYVRYLRAQKRDVVFVCGSDEHGTAIPIQATKESTTPQAIIDKYHEIMKQNFADLSISFDIYDRTSNPVHHETAQEFFTYLNDRGKLVVQESEQYYDEQTQTFLADRYIKGTCPNCGFTNAYGDQCERCGTSLSPDELINPVSTLSGAAPLKRKTSHWYLPLDKYEGWLRQWILEEHGNDWKPNVLGQCKSWIDAGLQPRAVTRDLDWGVKVPTPGPSSPSPQPIAQVQEGAKAPSPREGDGQAGYQMADPITYGLLKEFARQHRSQPTEAEEVFWLMVQSKKLEGHKFRRQHIIGNYIADFVCLKKNLVIEIDGLVHQQPENKTSDEERTAWLQSKGFKVLRFTNEQVLQQPDEVVKVVTSALNNLPDYKEGKDLSSPLGGQGAKVLYVWFDAPIGYISATKQWALNNNKDWQPYWLDKETKLVHFIGKDNIVFHCIIFPIMLKEHGFIVPDNVPANEFLNLEGDKMSTSRGWKLDMQDFIDDFVKKENGGPAMVDALRYYLTAIMPERSDSEFTWQGFADAVNNELVAVFANFVNRTFVLMHKLTSGKVPRFHSDIIDEKDKALIEEIKLTKEKVEKGLEDYRFRESLFEVVDLARKGNKYLQEKEPWIKAKQLTVHSSQLTGQNEIDNCLHLCLQLCANLAVLINPFLPNTAAKMCHLMKVVDKMLDWQNAGSLKLLSVGYSLRAPELLFRKIEDIEVETQIQKLKAALEATKTVDSSQLRVGSKERKPDVVNTTNEQQPQINDSDNPIPQTPNSKPTIEYDDFAKLDLRIGTITAAEKVKKADKLLQLSVDMGTEQRTIVSGIAQHFSPESLVGQQVMVVANLAPRKMRGIESEGMILTAEQPDGKLILVAPTQAAANGAEVR